ncbi:MAG: GNAT family N-acetyltransferase [Oscillospiraceae bacterium]|jgi:aminoglycoside 6'-N-acetyltransferase I
MLFLRPCDKTDIPNAAQMFCRVYGEEPFHEDWALDRAEKRISAYLSGTNSRGFAMTIETQVVGYLFGRIIISANCNSFYVDEIFVHPNYQRQGCGSMALAALPDELKKDNICKIELHALKEDANFYEKNGFKKTAFVNLQKTL